MGKLDDIKKGADIVSIAVDVACKIIEAARKAREEEAKKLLEQTKKKET